jgi:hypothetical protein
LDEKAIATVKNVEIGTGHEGQPIRAGPRSDEMSFHLY